MSAEKKLAGQALGKLLGILVGIEGSYTYVDKIAQASSRDLAMYYVRDALRDYASLMGSDKISDFPQAKVLADSLPPSEVEKDVETIAQLSSVPALREYLSYVASEALIQASALGNKQQYDLGRKIKDFLGFTATSQNPDKNEVDRLSAAIRQKAEQIASALQVPEEDVLAVANNSSILRSLLKVKQQ
ncbi:MAG: hypothetical protein ACP5UU_05680 [Thermoprotei archaeon]